MLLKQFNPNKVTNLNITHIFAKLQVRIILLLSYIEHSVFNGSVKMDTYFCFVLFCFCAKRGWREQGELEATIFQSLCHALQRTLWYDKLVCFIFSWMNCWNLANMLRNPEWHSFKQRLLERCWKKVTALPLLEKWQIYLTALWFTHRCNFVMEKFILSCGTLKDWNYVGNRCVH